MAKKNPVQLVEAVDTKTQEMFPQEQESAAQVSQEKPKFEMKLVDDDAARKALETKLARQKFSSVDEYYTKERGNCRSIFDLLALLIAIKQECENSFGPELAKEALELIPSGFAKKAETSESPKIEESVSETQKKVLEKFNSFEVGRKFTCDELIELCGYPKTQAIYTRFQNALVSLVAGGRVSCVRSKPTKYTKIS